MLSCTRWLKVTYLLTLATAVVLLLSKAAPIQAQRSIAYPFLPGALSTTIAMAAVNSNATPFAAYNSANTVLMQAGIPAGLAVGGGIGIGGGALGVGGGMGGGMGGMGGGMGGMQGGMGGGMMGMGGMPGGMGGGMGGMGGMGGFAGKGFGGFNGKKPL